MPRPPMTRPLNTEVSANDSPVTVPTMPLAWSRWSSGTSSVTLVDRAMPSHLTGHRAEQRRRRRAARTRGRPAGAATRRRRPGTRRGDREAHGRHGGGEDHGGVLAVAVDEGAERRAEHGGRDAEGAADEPGRHHRVGLQVDPEGQGEPQEGAGQRGHQRVGEQVAEHGRRAVGVERRGGGPPVTASVGSGRVSVIVSIGAPPRHVDGSPPGMSSCRRTPPAGGRFRTTMACEARPPPAPFAIRPESPGDSGPVRRLVARAFGSDAEALLVDRIRDSPGTCRRWSRGRGGQRRRRPRDDQRRPAARGGGDRPVVMLSPLAVDPPTSAGQYGSALVRSSKLSSYARGDDPSLPGTVVYPAASDGLGGA